MSTAQEVSSVDQGLAAVAHSNVGFIQSIYKFMYEKEGNIFFSPMSIEVALAMTYMGAGGETALQMSRGLHLPEDNKLTKRGFNSLMTMLKSDENITLEIANKIYVEKSIPLKKKFQEMAQKSFHSGVESIDFKTNFEAARAHINEWVKGKTNNKIAELISKGDLSSDTVLTLTNAIYFKGDFATKFNSSETQTEKFYVTPTQTKDVQMMRLYGSTFGHMLHKELDSQILEMPFKGEKMSLLVLLPIKRDGLLHLDSTICNIDFYQMIDSLVPTNMAVRLPKFKLEETTDLNELLKKLGMVDMFGSSANFTGLTDKPVSVSNVVHKAFIEINEEGAEAAAATNVGIRGSSGSGPLRFLANHPFLFAIIDRRLRTPIMAGRYSA